MDELKITIDQLKNYLGTGLEVFIENYGLEPEILQSINDKSEELETNIDCCTIDIVRPICYRLSDLDKEIEVNGERFVPKLKFMELWSRYHKDSIKSMNQIQVHETELYRVYHDIQKLFECHFWPFGDEYFEQGLVIDKMTVK